MVKNKIGVEIENQNVFVVSDIHGCYDELVSLLDTVPEDTLIIFLGDYIDRGAKSLEVLRLIMELVEQGKALAIRGNHEVLLLDFIENPYSSLTSFARCGGLETVESFSGSPVKDFSPFDSNASSIATGLASSLVTGNEDVIDFVKNLPLFVDMGKYLFVHAGIDSDVLEFDLSDDSYFLWAREEFNTVEHLANKVVFFGHTPVTLLDKKVGTLEDVWIHKSKTKIGIDGGCAFGLCLNGVLVDVDSNVISVYTKLNIGRFTDIDSKLASTHSL